MLDTIMIVFEVENAPSQFKEGVEFYNAGKYIDAVGCWRPLSDNDYAPAINNIAAVCQMEKNSFLDGKGIVEYYRRSAGQGLPEAQYNLANTMYRKGDGGKEFFKEAAKWFHESAKQGTMLAQFNLANMYIAGHGVSQDDKKSTKWYRKAARQGHAEAQYQFGLAYYSGGGALQSYIHAYMWFLIANFNGYECVEELEGSSWMEIIEEQFEMKKTDIAKVTIMAVRAMNSGYTTHDC